MVVHIANADSKLKSGGPPGLAFEVFDPRSNDGDSLQIPKQIEIGGGPRPHAFEPFLAHPNGDGRLPTSKHIETGGGPPAHNPNPPRDASPSVCSAHAFAFASQTPIADAGVNDAIRTLPICQR
jgi:hypothetical protein